MILPAHTRITFPAAHLAERVAETLAHLPPGVAERCADGLRLRRTVRVTVSPLPPPRARRGAHFNPE